MLHTAFQRRRAARGRSWRDYEGMEGCGCPAGLCRVPGRAKAPRLGLLSWTDASVVLKEQRAWGEAQFTNGFATLFYMSLGALTVAVSTLGR